MENDTRTVEQKIADLILEYLIKQFQEDDLFETLQPLITIAVRVGIDQGADVAMNMLDGIASDDSYPHWRQAIETATPEERITIMEGTRQNAIADRLKELKAKEQWQAVGRVLIEVVIAAAGMLLI